MGKPAAGSSTHKSRQGAQVSAGRESWVRIARRARVCRSACQSVRRMGTSHGLSRSRVQVGGVPVLPALQTRIEAGFLGLPWRAAPPGRPPARFQRAGVVAQDGLHRQLGQGVGRVGGRAGRARGRHRARDAGGRTPGSRGGAGVAPRGPSSHPATQARSSSQAPATRSSPSGRPAQASSSACHACRRWPARRPSARQRRAQPSLRARGGVCAGCGPKQCQPHYVHTGPTCRRESRDEHQGHEARSDRRFPAAADPCAEGHAA